MIARLDKAAHRLGSNRAALTKFCARTFIDHFKNNGGIASLPPGWREILRGQDGRTRAKIIRLPGEYDPDEKPVKAARAAEKRKKKKK